MYSEVKDQEDKVLKGIARDMYDGKIYTNYNISDLEKTHIDMVFMPLLFLSPREPYNGSNLSEMQIRSNKLWQILEKEKQINDYKNKFLPSIGMVYEYYDKAMPRSINGMPIFVSCRFLNKKDTEKFFTFLDEYKKLREEIDNF